MCGAAACAFSASALAQVSRTTNASGPTGAYGGVKRLLGEAEPGLESQLGRESRSIAGRGAGSEGREGIAAFLEKRPPRF